MHFMTTFTPVKMRRSEHSCSSWTTANGIFRNYAHSLRKYFPEDHHHRLYRAADLAEIGKRTMQLNASELYRVDGEQRMILLAIEDITN